MKNYLVFSMAALLVGASCNTKQEKAAEGFTGAPGEVKLVTLDPGHFHAALVQKVLIRKFLKMFMCTHPPVST